MSEGWYPPGVIPEPGSRYEFQDFIGSTFFGTFAGHRFLREPMGGGMAVMLVSGEDVVLRLEFSDRAPFETNVPVRYRDA